MEINMGAFNILLREKFKSNQAEMARTLGINRHQLNTILNNNGKSAGKKVIAAIIKFCDTNNYDFRDYIFLTNNVNKS